MKIKKMFARARHFLHRPLRRALGVEWGKRALLGEETIAGGEDRQPERRELKSDKCKRPLSPAGVCRKEKKEFERGRGGIEASF